MSDVLSFAEVAGQQVELLPARTLMQAPGSGSSDSNSGGGDPLTTLTSGLGGDDPIGALTSGLGGDDPIGTLTSGLGV